MHRHSEVQPDRSLRQGRLSAVSLVLVVYGVVGWYATRALPLSVSAAPPDPVLSFSLLPGASPGAGSSGGRTRASTTAEPESRSEPEPEPEPESESESKSEPKSEPKSEHKSEPKSEHKSEPKSVPDLGLERQPTQPSALTAESSPEPDASAVQTVKPPVFPPDIKTVREQPRVIRSSGPTAPVKPIHRQSTRQQSARQQSARQQSARQQSTGQQSVSGDNVAEAVTPVSDAFLGGLTTASNTSSSGTVVVSHLDYDGPPPRPVYPQHALRARQQGLVVIRVVIGKDGSVLRADVSQSSGFELLDAAAVSASLRTKFHPYSRNGIAFSASADLPFNFVVKP